MNPSVSIKPDHVALHEAIAAHTESQHEAFMLHLCGRIGTYAYARLLLIYAEEEQAIRNLFQIAYN